jgi:hypothetical protein
MDDVIEHVTAMRNAGATEMAFFPGPTEDLTRDDLDAVAAIQAAIG